MGREFSRIDAGAEATLQEDAGGAETHHPRPEHGDLRTAREVSQEIHGQARATPRERIAGAAVSVVVQDDLAGELLPLDARTASPEGANACDEADDLIVGENRRTQAARSQWPRARRRRSGRRRGQEDARQEPPTGCGHFIRNRCVTGTEGRRSISPSR